MHKDTHHSQRGVTLIEILVTMIITSIGLMGLMSLQMQALKGTKDAGNRSQALWLKNDIIDRIQANQAFSDSYITPADGVNCSIAITKACDGADVCTGEELANWDKFDVACPRNNDIISHPIQYLSGANLTISVASDTNLLVELTWKTRADDESITGAVRTANSGQLEMSGLAPR
ncbi:type IV pilus modification protein [Oleispira antarctica RB-8]|uniref:Type IV pilus modification protein n=1 Tax=Oleispira antarctica RB-8 TaxID=698738 RepID=R4YNP3_OLEAN|nr:type IV pilus modification protein [Oleispira antarctica RB-8]